LRREFISDALLDPRAREAIGFTTSDDEPMQVVLELNVQHPGGLTGAVEQLHQEWKAVIDTEPPGLTVETYCRAELTLHQIQALVSHDLNSPPNERALYRVWPDFPIQPLIDRSSSTIKADAARRSYRATGRNIVWAVVDSGIDADHRHFRRYGNLTGGVESLHCDFTQQLDAHPGDALTDGFGHGTHVAGIIAGAAPTNTSIVVTEQIQDPLDPKRTRVEVRKVEDLTLLAGMAPETKLVSLKVLDAEGYGSSMNVVRALEYIRTTINSQKLQRVHGVNLSVGYEFDANWFACGQSPICVAVDRLVRSGVVVVVAAGNTGYATLITTQRQSSLGLTMSINDPGNAEMAITVGATHRDMPHVYGVSYFSSKGPTGDGRRKPDLVAPGERITSCAAGLGLAAVSHTLADTVYVEASGTSEAAPHVSGAIAALLSIRGEFIGQPERVKQIFTQTATSLGRESHFQGDGLVDLMRAIQSV
jgi:serine protease AprX